MTYSNAFSIVILSTIILALSVLCMQINVQQRLDSLESKVERLEQCQDLRICPLTK